MFHTMEKLYQDLFGKRGLFDGLHGDEGTIGDLIEHLKGFDPNTK